MDLLSSKCEYNSCRLCYLYKMWPHHWKHFELLTFNFLFHSDRELFVPCQLCLRLERDATYRVSLASVSLIHVSVVNGVWVSINGPLRDFLWLRTQSFSEPHSRYLLMLVAVQILLSAQTAFFFGLCAMPKSAFKLVHFSWVFSKRHAVFEHILTHKIPIHSSTWKK